MIYHFANMNHSARITTIHENFTSLKSKTQYIQHTIQYWQFTSEFPICTWYPPYSHYLTRLYMTIRKIQNTVHLVDSIISKHIACIPFSDVFCFCIRYGIQWFWRWKKTWKPVQQQLETRYVSISNQKIKWL